MTQHERIRLAVVLRQCWLQGLQRQRDAVVTMASVISTYLKRLRVAEKELRLAHLHGLELIEPLLEDKVQFQARSLRITLQDRENNHFPTRHQFALRDFYQDLVQLEQEFPDVRVDWKASQLIVETEVIILEDVELGHFTLRLDWKRWGQDSSLNCLQVIAEEPNTSELSSDVTHPHVREGELCPGDASSALHKALVEGRLAEAFLIVRAVLTTYNSKSAYVRLDEWQGVPCYDCGSVTNPEDRTYCEGCEHDYCQTCGSSCSNCGNTRCLACLSECSVCQEGSCSNCSETSSISDQSICRSCREVCPGCQSTVGPGDLDSETGLCPVCVEDSTPSEEIAHEAVPLAAS